MRFAFLTLLVLCLAFPASAATVVVNFDDLPTASGCPCPAVPAGYGGVNWDTNFGVWMGSGNYAPHSSPNVLLGNRLATGTATLIMTFVTPPVEFLGAWFSGNPSTSVTATFDLYLGGVHQATSLTLALSGTPIWLASGYSGPVDEVRLTSYRAYFVMDDFTYDNSSAGQVPEPDTFALLGAGLGAVALLRRRS